MKAINGILALMFVSLLVTMFFMIGLVIAPMITLMWIPLLSVGLLVSVFIKDIKESFTK